MPEYPAGTPSWVELSSQDPDGSIAFYEALFDWKATEPGPVEETGGYRMFMQGEANVAGFMPAMQEGQPTAWATYIQTDDADATAEKVKAAGGQVIVEPMDVMDIGRMAFFIDTAGAVFGVWEAKTFVGADLVNEPNSFCWNEALVRDGEAAKAFYTSVFDYEAGKPGFEGAPQNYTVWMLGERQVGGMMEMSAPYFPDEVPPHWSVCFAVADVDAIVAKARELGATVMGEVMDMPIGRFAILLDPQGASLQVMQMAG